MVITIGILAMQGDIREHKNILKKLHVKTVEVRKKEDLKDIDALIIPGGESTTIGKLLVEFQLDIVIRDLAQKGMPIYGTCAGAILLSKNIKNSQQPRLGLLDIIIERNAYGRQIDSFEAKLHIKQIGTFPGVFIRAPVIEDCNGAEVLARYDEKPVFIVNQNIMVTTFHPELTNDIRVHKYFLEMVKEFKEREKKPVFSEMI